MDNNQIAVVEFCLHHQTDEAFVVHLHQAGLIQLEFTSEGFFIPGSQLENLERMWRLHNDLDINIEGLETVSHLLDRIEELNSELNRLRNRLRFYDEL